MAKIGAKYPCFKTATGSAGIVLGKLNAANVTINMASGEIYGDDAIAEEYNEFVSGSIALESTSLTDSDATTLFGHTSTSGHVTCNVEDTAPEGKFAYYRVLMVGGKKYYKAFGYPRVRAVLGNESDATKGNTINFTTDSVTLNFYANDDGDWREFETFEDEDDAISFVDTYCAIAASTTPATPAG